MITQTTDGPTMRAISCLALVLACALPSARASEDPPNPKLVPPAPLHEQVLRLSGDPDRPVDLTVTLYTPEGSGPFPLVVMNHGSSGNRQAQAAMPRYRFTMSAYYFLSRGYAVALPMMRGFAGSGGQQEAHGCDFAQIALENGRDIEAVIAGLSQNPQIDTSRTVVAGQSFGGWNTLGVGALRPHGVRGLIDFVGGIRTSACDGFQNDDAKLAEAAGTLGAATRLPSIWIFGDNDSLFPPDVWRAMYTSYTGRGADAELVDVGRFMDDSHQMLSRPESLRLWAPRVDAFLTRIGMPGTAALPQYVPLPWPKPSGFAALADVAAVPGLSDSGRGSYRNFLSDGLPRAFVLAPGGQSAVAQGGFDPLARAQGLCRNAGFACVPYALDRDVVYVPPARIERPASTRFAALTNVAAVPWVNDKGREAYRNFLARPAPRAFIVGTGGESIATFDAPDPLSRGMATCANMHLDCRPYAVDDAVVWVAPPPAPRPPPASGFADIADVARVPLLTAQSRGLYSQFLATPSPRAFVIGPAGQAAATQGGYDPLGRAIGKCRAHGLICRPYAVDDKVVWAGVRR